MLYLQKAARTAGLSAPIVTKQPYLLDGKGNPDMIIRSRGTRNQFPREQCGRRELFSRFAFINATRVGP